MNDFEEGLIEGRMFPTQNFHKELVPAILKDYSSFAAPDCKVKLVKVLHQAEEIFGTKENGKYTIGVPDNFNFRVIHSFYLLDRIK